MEALATWVSQWEVIVGLVVIILCLFLACIINFKDVYTGQWRAGSRESAPPEVERRSVNLLGFFRLLDFSAIQLLVFGSLKSSPAAALLVCLVYPVLIGFFFVFYEVVQLRATMEGKRASVAMVESLKPSSVYTDIHLGNMLQCLAIFGGQVMLYSLVLQGVIEREAYADGFIPAKQALYFLAGAVVGFVQEIVYIIDDPWRHEWETFWSVYFGKPGFKAARLPWIRAAMSFVINYYFHKAMMYVLPLVLMESSNSMEFVKDATSVLFISRIDDVIFSAAHLVPLSIQVITVEPELSKSDIDL